MKVPKFTLILILIQVAFIIIFAIFADYNDNANAKNPVHSKDVSKGGEDPRKNKLHTLYDSKLILLII